MPGKSRCQHVLGTLFVTEDSSDVGGPLTVVTIIAGPNGRAPSTTPNGLCQLV